LISFSFLNRQIGREYHSYTLEDVMFKKNMGANSTFLFRLLSKSIELAKKKRTRDFYPPFSKNKKKCLYLEIYLLR